ncbi:hypothetical protein SASPL_152877 [Salvia splendens]|uniref:VOC domain-containing protein n=1 Tax=Salvia splendens TaxID=180675 RepID=A0A8X8W464_SALSN|nr:hypothetical protein SASPL_152877 [Salvia splendens]
MPGLYLSVELAEDRVGPANRSQAGYGQRRWVRSRGLWDRIVCEDLEAAEQRLAALGIDVEGGVSVHQIFFHDLNGYMVEICSCANFPVVPI